MFLAVVRNTESNGQIPLSSIVSFCLCNLRVRTVSVKNYILLSYECCNDKIGPTVQII